jgi:hypothetical protein
MVETYTKPALVPPYWKPTGLYHGEEVGGQCLDVMCLAKHHNLKELVSLLSRVPPCFGGHVKPLVPAAFAGVSTHEPALGPRDGL